LVRIEADDLVRVSPSVVAGKVGVSESKLTDFANLRDER